MNNQKGSILAITIALVLIFALFGLSAIYVSGLQNEAMVKQIASTEAFWLAEGGLNKGIWELNNGSGSWYGWDSIGGGNYTTSSPSNLSDDGYYDIRVNSVGGTNPTVLAYGYTPVDGTPSKDGNNLAKRVVKATLYKNSFNFGILGNKSITTGGNIITDSYNSSSGVYCPGGAANCTTNVGNNGDIMSNGDISVGSNSYIDGDIIVGPGGEFNDYPIDNITQELKESWDITNGTISENEYKIPLPDVTVPPELLGSGANTTYNGTTITSGDYRLPSLKVTKSGSLEIQGPARIYLTGERDNEEYTLDVTGSVYITGNNVKIYADELVKISGSGNIVNNSTIPSNFLLFCTGTNVTSAELPTAEVSMDGGGDFYGAIYAPKGDIKIGGGSEIYGSIIGQDLKFNGDANIHYDEALTNTTYGDENYSVQSWQEIF